MASAGRYYRCSRWLLPRSPCRWLAICKIQEVSRRSIDDIDYSVPAHAADQHDELPCHAVRRSHASWLQARSPAAQTCFKSPYRGHAQTDGVDQRGIASAFQSLFRTGSCSAAKQVAGQRDTATACAWPASSRRWLYSARCARSWVAATALAAITGSAKRYGLLTFLRADAGRQAFGRLLHPVSGRLPWRTGGTLRRLGRRPMGRHSILRRQTAAIAARPDRLGLRYQHRRGYAVLGRLMNAARVVGAIHSCLVGLFSRDFSDGRSLPQPFRRFAPISSILTASAATSAGACLRQAGTLSLMRRKRPHHWAH